MLKICNIFYLIKLWISNMIETPDQIRCDSITGSRLSQSISLKTRHNVSVTIVITCSAGVLGTTVTLYPVKIKWQTFKSRRRSINHQCPTAHIPHPRFSCLSGGRWVEICCTRKCSWKLMSASAGYLAESCLVKNKKNTFYEMK